MATPPTLPQLAEQAKHMAETLFAPSPHTVLPSRHQFNDFTRVVTALADAVLAGTAPNAPRPTYDEALRRLGYTPPTDTPVYDQEADHDVS